MTSNAKPRGPRGFWSYVHKDDDAELGRIRRLATDVAEQFEMLTGEELQLFLDRDALQWGDIWRQKVDEAIAAGTLFVPVLTPRFFKSIECRRELNLFARHATSLGVKELVLPIYYVTVAELGSESSKDDLFALIRTFQWEDWRDLRFQDTASEPYRRAVFSLAERLSAAVEQSERSQAPLAPLTPSNDIQQTDEAPGFIDRVAATEEAFPKLAETLGSITERMKLTGQLAEDATAEMRRADKQAPGFAARLLISQRLAKQLAEPAESISKLADVYVTQLNEIDQGLRLLIEQSAIQALNDGEAATTVCDFFTNIRKLSLGARSTEELVQTFISSLAPIEGLARALRPPLRRLREGLTKIAEGVQVFDEWLRLIDVSPLRCPDESAPTDSHPASLPR